MILSAGASRRMGRPKALLPYREGTFLEHLIQVTRHPRIGITRVVLGAGADEIRNIAKLDPAVVVINQQWERGQLSSLQQGLRSLKDIATDGIVLCPVDHPLVSAVLVSELIEQFYQNNSLIAVPTYQGKRGHPVIFSSALYSELLDAPADKGARAVVWAHADSVLEVPTDEQGAVLNLNDPSMLKHASQPKSD
jgi:molybdenum cofactor cytidylyltransferase